MNAEIRNREKVLSQREIAQKSEKISSLYNELGEVKAEPANFEAREKAKIIVKNIFDDLEKLNVELKDPDSINFNSLGRNFVRVENIKDALKLINEKEPILLKGKHENCIESHGLEGSVLGRVREEGRSKINQSLIILSFNQNEEMKIKNINSEQLAKGGNVIDRSSVRIAEGKINTKNLNYALLQFPIYLFPEEKLVTKNEKDILNNCLEILEEAKDLKEELEQNINLSEGEKKEKLLEFFRKNHEIIFSPVSRYIKVIA